MNGLGHAPHGRAQVLESLLQVLPILDRDRDQERFQTGMLCQDKLQALHISLHVFAGATDSAQRAK